MLEYPLRNIGDHKNEDILKNKNDLKMRMTSNMKKTKKRELTIRMKIITQFQFQFHILGRNQTEPFVCSFFPEKIFFPSSNIRFNQKCNKCILCNKIKEDGSFTSTGNKQRLKLCQAQV